MEQIERMEFYKFNLLMKYLNIYIDKENKAQGEGGNSQEQEAEDMKGKTSRELARAKRNMPSKGKMPNMSNFKMPKLK
jgi:hypothetical protein